MPRNVPPALGAHLKSHGNTVCYILKIMPKTAPSFGITTLNRDVDYDDGDGLLTYHSRRGYTAMDVSSKADMSVDNSEAAGLLAEYPADGVTKLGITSGEYDGARFVQYLINYEDTTQGHVIINSGQVGQIKTVNDLTMSMEMRSLIQILKQTSMLELTSITDRAKYGDERNKMPLIWYDGTVTAVGAETDRTFTSNWVQRLIGPLTLFVGDGVKTSATMTDEQGNPVVGASVTYVAGNGVELAYSVSGNVITLSTAPAEGVVVAWSGTIGATTGLHYFEPGVVHWETGENVGHENEIEDSNNDGSSVMTFTFAIPTRLPIAVGDTFKLRRDSDKSKARAIADNNLPNMRAEPELPRADAASLQSPGA